MSFKVGLDDGHGTKTAGKRTVALKEDIKFNGKTRKKGSIIHENEFNEAIMKKVEPHLKRCGISYMETAPTDDDTSLNTRAKRANDANCDVLVSIHANALEGTKWQTGAYGLVVIKTKGCQSKTDKLAKIMYKHLKEVDFPSNGETKYGVRTDTGISGFTLAILRQTKMPAVLVELGFMDNWNDVKKMCTEKFQNECAEAIAKAVCEYLGVTYKKESKPTTSTKRKMIKNIYSKEINIRSTADWDGKIVGKLKAGDSVTLKEGPLTAKNGSTKMYRTISDTYVTASNKYVKIIEI